MQFLWDSERIQFCENYRKNAAEYGKIEENRKLIILCLLCYLPFCKSIRLLFCVMLFYAVLYYACF